MEQVKLSDRKEQNAGAKIDWFINEIIDKSEFQANLCPLCRIFTNAMFDLKLRGKLYMLGTTRIDKWDEPLLIKSVRAAPIAIFDPPFALGTILNVHITADNCFWCRDKRLGIDQAS